MDIFYHKHIRGRAVVSSKAATMTMTKTDVLVTKTDDENICFRHRLVQRRIRSSICFSILSRFTGSCIAKAIDDSDMTMRIVYTRYHNIILYWNNEIRYYYYSDFILLYNHTSRGRGTVCGRRGGWLGWRGGLGRRGCCWTGRWWRARRPPQTRPESTCILYIYILYVKMTSM